MSDPSPTTSPSKRGHNRAPQSDRLELDELGLAGVRMRLDALLASVHGIDDEQLARSGLDMAQLAAHRDAFVTMMTGIVLDERADAGANTRLLAIRLLGHLRLVEAADALVEVLRSHHERPTARIAAAEALGRIGLRDLESVLVGALDDPQPDVTRAIARVLLGKRSASGRAAIEALRRRAPEALARQLGHLLDPSRDRGDPETQLERVEIVFGSDGLPCRREV